MDLDLRNLRAQIEALRRENIELRSSRPAALAAPPHSAGGQDPNNDSELEHRVREIEFHIMSGITPRFDYLEQVATMMGNIESSIAQRIVPCLEGLETRFLQLQQQLDHHQTFIQELWAGQPRGPVQPMLPVPATSRSPSQRENAHVASPTQCHTPIHFRMGTQDDGSDNDQERFYE